jgi:hypothetical protein
MPTGYTANILDGKVKTFQEFAKTCMRAFGATIHMRDDSMDSEYVPQIPNNYHSKAIKEAEKHLKDAETMTDKQVVSNRKKELNESRKWHVKKISEIKKDRKKLDTILSYAMSYQPPTSEHTGIKDFMIQQLAETIKYDGETDYHDKALERIKCELSSLDANKIRNKKIAKANEELQYHSEELRKEIERCDKSNKWVVEFIKSLTLNGKRIQKQG